MKRYLPTLVLIVPVLIALFALSGGGVGDATWMGITVAGLDAKGAAELRVPFQAGQAVVVKVKGPALASRVIVGDIILGINGRKVGSVNEFLQAARKVMQARGPGGQVPDVVLTLNRLGWPVTVTMLSEWMEAFLRRR